MKDELKRAFIEAINNQNPGAELGKLAQLMQEEESETKPYILIMSPEMKPVVDAAIKELAKDEELIRKPNLES